MSDCIFETHQLWQSGFSWVYSNCCCSCWFEPEIIKIGQSSHKMYGNNILNFQESMTILNACIKKSGNLLYAPRRCVSHGIKHYIKKKIKAHIHIPENGNKIFQTKTISFYVAGISSQKEKAIWRSQFYNSSNTFWVDCTYCSCSEGYWVYFYMRIIKLQ